jgi:hypothetical protein
MPSGADYRRKAADLAERGRAENNPVVRAELESLALSYLRLADQADLNAAVDIVYETPPAQERPQPTQQQQQPQPREDDAEN